MSQRHCLGSVEELPDPGSKGFELNGQGFFAVRRQHSIHVYRNSCPHLGIELEWQPDRFLDATGDFIQCSTHGALFLIGSGECISGPCQGQSLKAVPYDIIDNRLWIDLT
jgi:nitrite reductase/ring-hydroxylating ferredoxin subunit